MKNSPVWNRDALLKSPLFAPLHPILAILDSDDFPTRQDCNVLLDVMASHSTRLPKDGNGMVAYAANNHPVTVQSGMPLRFVPQELGKLSFEAQYEPRCYLTGEVQMRKDNLHDLFNALVWLTFPCTKAAINARHYRALMGKHVTDGVVTGSQRGAVRDVNTLLDESGVIVAYSDDDSGVELAELLRNFKWKELFWQRREQVRSNMGFYLFGHGLYEKALQPYVGMTGQGLLVRVATEFFSWAAVRQLAHLDGLLAEYLAQPGYCRLTRELSPVPLLGIPGWSADNDNVSYYENTAYFRPGRRA